MLPYRLITSGKNQRREYFSLNRSPLFANLPDRDFAEEQKLSYEKFLYEKLPRLLTFYFPAEFSDYNNNVHINVESLDCAEPEISEEQAREDSVTWNHLVSFVWNVSWDCQRMQITLRDGDLKENINFWIEESFKIGKFTLKEKSLQKWEIKETKGELKILLEILETTENNLTIKFRCQQAKKLPFCSLPKINEQGNFIINGHDKVVVFQSVRAPSIYHFLNQNKSFYSEIIPLKGPWISICYNTKKPRAIDLKFLNTGTVIDFLDVLKTFEFPAETLEKLFTPEELNLEDYQEAKVLEIGVNLPHFLFTKRNSYFKLGRLGRRKYHQKLNIFQQIAGQVLAEDLYDENKKIILKKNTILSKENLQVLRKNFENKKLVSIPIPHSTNGLYFVKIKSPRDAEKIATVIGSEENSLEEKSYFDLADLICAVANHLNLYHGLNKIEEEEDKDKLENQIVRRVGDLVYNIFDNKLGGFLQDIDKKYLSSISQINHKKKVDLLKIPNLKDFENLIKQFFNTSALVQLQNQNNPLAEISYAQKVSVLGLGGFNSSNTTLAARNVNSSYCGRYDLVETPEGQRVGLVHNLTINSEVNNDGQVMASYYVVHNGIITPQLVYLTSEEEWDKYITYPSISINEKNEIIEAILPALHRGKLVSVPKEKINYIYSSFHQLNSSTTATIPFFSHNDATRISLTSMQKQAIQLLVNEEPLVSSGIEYSLFKSSSSTVKAKAKGQVEYVDSQQIIVKESQKEARTYELKQLIVSNKNTLSFSSPLVKKGEKIEKGQIIACGSFAKNNELALGVNLRVAYFCWKLNYEDAIVISERLVKEDILTSFFVKKHTIVLYNTKYGPESFTNDLPLLEKNKLAHLDKNGIIKIGSEIKGNDILVGKITPRPSSQQQETEEELLLRSILGEKAQRFVNSSLYLPNHEQGIVYKVERKKATKNKNELELVEVYLFHERKVEAGDKLTTRFGNKGVVAKVVPEIDMPFDEEGKIIDIIFNPLGIPSRMNIGQLLETILASAAQKLNTKLLIRPFNTPSLEVIKTIIEEAKIKDFGLKRLFDGKTGLPFQQKIYSGYVYTFLLNHKVTDKFHVRGIGPRSLIYQQPLKGRSQGGGQRAGAMEIDAINSLGAAYNVMEMMSAKSDDIHKRRLMQNHLLFDDRKIDLLSSQSESFNLLIQYLRGIGFDLKATDYLGKEIDFYKYFSKI